MTYCVLGKSSHRMAEWLTVRESLLMFVMILSNMKKILFATQEKWSRHKWGNKMTMQANLFKSTFHTECGAMPLNYSANTWPKILLTARSSCNYRGYIVIVSHVQELKEGSFHRPQPKQRKMNEQRGKDWWSVLNSFPEREEIETNVWVIPQNWK